MTNFRERVNAHLPIVLQFLSTLSLIAIALSALCGSNSLKKIVEQHAEAASDQVQLGKITGSNHNH